MLTQDDIQKLKEALATKDDLAKLITLEEFDGFRKEIKEEIFSLKEAIQSLTTSIDKLVKSVENLRNEYVAITAKVDAHEKWIKQASEKLNIKLEY